MSIRTQEFPEFAPALRGYDRLQVDGYVERLREYALEVEDRAISAEAALADLQQETVELRRQVAAAGGGELPQRLAHILDVANEEAEDVRQRARAEADELSHRARAGAEQSRRRARAEAERIVADAVASRDAVQRQIRDLELTRARFLEGLGHIHQGIARLLEHPPPKSLPAASTTSERTSNDRTQEIAVISAETGGDQPAGEEPNRARGRANHGNGSAQKAANGSRGN
jgi:cell division septum initiation protein DivIVA